MIFKKVSLFAKGRLGGISCGMVILTGVAHADLTKSLQDFFNEVGGSASATDPGAYNSQAAGFYTLGTVHTRVPSQNLQLASIRMPSFQAGCGGIDAFAGSFSMLNSDQLIAVGKAIASNTAMFAFELGLETVSPTIAKTMGKGLERLREWTQFEINSCEQAASIVGGLWPKNDATSRTVCQAIGRSEGMFSDAAASRHGCGTEGKRLNTINAGRNKEKYQSLIQEDTNIAWQAIRKNPLIEGDMKELFMTLSGTTILAREGQGDSAELKYRFIAPGANQSQVIDALLKGGDIKVLACDEPEKCLNPTYGSKTVKISPHAAFEPKIATLLTEVSFRIKQNEDSNPQIQQAYLALLNKTSLPIHKMMNVNAAYQTQNPVIDINAYSELIALDITYAYVDEVLQQILLGASQVQFDGDEMHKWREYVDSARQQLRTKQRELKHNTQLALEMIERTQMLERILVGQLSGKVVNSLTWQQGAK